MDLLRLLSLSAIVLSVVSCIVMFILHRQTSSRLDALTQANLGITHTIHRLISSNMPTIEQQSQQSGLTTDITSQDMNGGNNLQVAERIVVSDNESESESESESENDSGSDDESDSGSEHSDSVSNGDNDGDDEDAPIHMVSLNIESNDSSLREHDLEHITYNKRNVEEVESDNDSESDSDSEIDLNIEDEDENDNENDDGENTDDTVINDTPVVTDDTDDNDNDNDIGEIITVQKEQHDVVNIENGDNDNMIETIELGDLGDLQSINNTLLNNLTIDSSTVEELTEMLIEPLKRSASVSVSVSVSGPNNADALKHFKVEELRKMAVENLHITEEEAKKLKKNMLIQRLTQ